MSMKAVSRALRVLILVVSLVVIIVTVVYNWSAVFSKVVRGEVMEVERVIQPTAMIGSNVTVDQMFSSAVLIRAESGEIFSSSSTDRQFAVVRKGFCIEARLYPYPPWDFEKADTYFNARLVKVLADCKRFAAIPGAAPEAPAPVLPFVPSEGTSTVPAVGASPGASAGPANTSQKK